jgi:hypothetical protein
MCIDTITRIKLDAANQAFGMLAQGYLPLQIIDFMGGPYRQHQTPHPMVANAMISAIGQRHIVASSKPSQRTLQPPAHVGSSIQPSIEGPAAPEPRVRAESSIWRRIEPKPTGPNAPTNADILGTYALMQQRFDQGDLAKTAEQPHPPYMVSREGALSTAQNMSLFQEAAPRLQTMTPNMEDATLQVSREAFQPTPHLLLQQATSTMGSVTSNAQDAALTSLTTQAMSQLQKTTPNMQDAASTVQNYAMTAETVADGNITEGLDDTGTTKALKTGKKKPKLSTRNEMEGTPAGTVNQGPRCAKCIKAHKRCTHRTQDSPASNLPLGSSPFATSSTPSNNYVSSAGIPEGGYTPAPVTMPDHSFTLPAASAEVSVQGGAKKAKAAPKRKR